MADAAAKSNSTSHSHKLIQQLLHSIFDSSPIGIGVCDADLRIVIVNKAWAAMDGLAPEEHEGKTVLDVLDVVACPVNEVMNQVLATGQPVFGLEIVAKVPARSDVGRWIVNLFPLKDQTGKTTHVGSVTIDTTPKAGFESFVVARGVGTHQVSVSKLKAEPERTMIEHVSPREHELTPLLPSTRTAGAYGNGVHDSQQHTFGDRRENHLSPREEQIVRLLASSRVNKEIAADLGISVKTVQTYRARIMLKLSIHSTGEIVRYAVRHRMIST